jgi:site-specific DNA-methyltransferase (adenine-specific)
MNQKFNILLVDPPWAYPSRNRKDYGGAAESHYSTMTLEELCKLPVPSIAADDSVIFLWATWPRLKDSIRLMEEWGFIYRTLGFIWVKLFKCGKFASGMGMGFFTKEGSEPCLLGTKSTHRNSMVAARHDISSIIISPRNIHSRKPAEVREKIVQLFGDLPRCELFAREKTEGWKCFGNEIESDFELKGDDNGIQGLRNRAEKAH